MIRTLFAAGALAALCTGAQAAQEFYVSEPVVKDSVQTK